MQFQFSNFLPLQPIGQHQQHNYTTISLEPYTKSRTNNTMNPTLMVEQQTQPEECSYAGTRVFGIQELLEEVLKYLPPGAILRLQRVCKNWYHTMNTSHFKKSLFLLPIAATEVWDIDRRAAHGRTHGDREQVVLGRRRGVPLSSPGKLLVPCKRCSSRGFERPAESTDSVRVPIHFNSLICDQRPEDKADNMDERASRHACAEVCMRDLGLGYVLYHIEVHFERC